MPTVLQLKLGDIAAEVVFKDIKNLHLGVGPPADKVRISAALRMSPEAIRAFRNLGSAEGKYFTTSGEEASSYARQAVKAFGDLPYTLVRTQVPTSIFEGLSPETVGRGITAWVLPNESLPGLTPYVMSYMPLPGAP